MQRQKITVCSQRAETLVTMETGENMAPEQSRAGETEVTQVNSHLRDSQGSLGDRRQPPAPPSQKTWSAIL